MSFLPSWPFARSPTVDDLKIRSCFICREEHESLPGVRPSRAEHGFVHPCHCTLVAHERCLLRWIDSGDEARSRCASCGEQYVVMVPPPPFALRVLDAGNTVFNNAEEVVFKASLIGVGVGLVAGSYIACTAYGYYTARCMLGRRLFNVFIKNPLKWPAAAWLELPFAPVVIAGHVGHQLSYSFVASSSLWLMSSVPIRPFPPNTVEITLAKIFRRMYWDWPPPPWLLGVTYPFVLRMYVLARQTLEKRLLDGAAIARRRQVRPAPGDLRMMIADFDFDLQLQPAQGGERQQAHGNIHITKRDLSQTLLSMLAMPPLAGFAGSLLRRLAMHSRALRVFLAVGTLSSANDDALTWGDYEPVWWQSLVGLALVALGRDALLLAYKMLLQREDEARSIVDFPFVGIDPASIDLQVVP